MEYNRQKKSIKTKIAVIGIVAFAIYIALLDKYHLKERNEMEKITFIGTYQTKQMKQPKLYKKEEAVKVENNSVVIFRGNFNKDIDRNISLFFYMHYLQVEIRKNGKVLYEFGTKGSYPSIVKSEGKIWGNLTSKGISKEDTIEFIVYNPYGSLNYKSVYNDFVNSFSTGNRVSLLFASIQKNWCILLMIGILLFIGVTLLAFGILLRLRNPLLLESVILCALYTFVSGVWFLLQIDTALLLFPYPVLIFVLSTLGMVLQIPLLTKYTACFMVTKAKKLIEVIHIVSSFIVPAFMILQILGKIDAYQFRRHYVVLLGIFLLIMLGCILYEWIQGKARARKVVMFSMFFFILFCIFEVLNYKFEIVKHTVFLFVAYVIFIGMQIILSIRQIEFVMMQSERAEQMEKELIKHKVSIMLSQIQPHFLYNSIASIQMLCKKNPEVAQKALGEFAGFLRGNMESLTSIELIPFTQELRHVKAFLYLEKMRFGKMLEIVYEIEVKDFYIPPLTIQPIVENASKYGVGDKETGGTIFIRTKEDQSNIFIIIEDDGVGFDMRTMETLDLDKRSHVGIKYVRDHIKKQCRGTLDIHSQIGEGTIVTIKIPKEEFTYEHNCN